MCQNWMLVKFILKKKHNKKCEDNCINNDVINDLKKKKKLCKTALYGNLKKRREKESQRKANKRCMRHLLMRVKARKMRVNGE